MHILVCCGAVPHKHERGTRMAALIIGLVVLIVMVVWASYTPEGTWLVYFDSPAETEHSETEAKEDVGPVQALANGTQAEGRNTRVVALPNKSRSKIGVLR